MDRPRRSTRPKSYAAEKYHFGDSSEEDASTRRRKKNEQRDASFEEDINTAAPEVDGDVGEASKDSDTAMSEFESEVITERPARRRRAAPRKRQPSSAPELPKAKTTIRAGYLDIPLAAQDGNHQAKTYVGPNDRSLRRHHLVSAWYGQDEERVMIIQKLLDRWFQWPILPPKKSSNYFNLPPKGAWIQDYAGKEGKLAAQWRKRVEASMASLGPPVRPLSPAEDGVYRLPQHSMPVLVGPEADREFVFAPGKGHAISQSGLPYEEDTSESKVPSGWMFDTGGIVTSMSWAPRPRDQCTQVLALAVLPHIDQDIQDYEDEAAREEAEAYGIAQLWEMKGENPQADSAPPTSEPPVLRRTLCFPHGRVTRVKWNPVGSYLAVLCANGTVYVVEADTSSQGEFEELANPLAILYFQDEEGIKATSMCWANMNRLVVGYSDGSIALWSVHSSKIISRHAVHHSHVIDVATGYPTMPYIVASTPLGGIARIVDLEAPSHECSEFQAINVITQPGLLDYSDHMLGFFSIYPSARVINTTIGFMHHANFPLFRTTFTGDSFPSAISVGKTHPYLLIGLMDGSVYCLNTHVEHFNSRVDATHRLRLFQHEHRPHRLFPSNSPAGQRGASRIVQGFAVENNRNPKNEASAAVAKKGKASKKAAVENEDDEEIKPGEAARAALHEPLTRISALEWNPNDGYGCWAAAAMASGLVRVMDLGLEDDDDNDDDDD